MSLQSEGLWVHGVISFEQLSLWQREENCTLFTEKTSSAIFLFFQFQALTNETKISSGVFKRVVISKFHSSQHLVASFRFWDDDTEFSVSPLTSPADSSSPQCASDGAADDLFVQTHWTSAVVDGEFLSHHAIADRRKIDAGKINMFAVDFSSTCPDVALHPFIPHCQMTVGKLHRHFSEGVYMCRCSSDVRQAVCTFSKSRKRKASL